MSFYDNVSTLLAVHYFVLIHIFMNTARLQKVSKTDKLRKMTELTKILVIVYGYENADLGLCYFMPGQCWDAGTADVRTMALALMLRRYHWLC